MHLAKTITFDTGPVKLVWECCGIYKHTLILDGQATGEDGAEKPPGE